MLFVVLCKIKGRSFNKYLFRHQGLKNTEHLQMLFRIDGNDHFLLVVVLDTVRVLLQYFVSLQNANDNVIVGPSLTVFN